MGSTRRATAVLGRAILCGIGGVGSIGGDDGYMFVAGENWIVFHSTDEETMQTVADATGGVLTDADC